MFEFLKGSKYFMTQVRKKYLSLFEIKLKFFNKFQSLYLILYSYTKKDNTNLFSLFIP